MSYFLRSRVPVYGVGIIGFLMVFAYYIPINELNTASTFLQDFSVLTTNIIAVLFLVHLTFRHGVTIYKRKAGTWYYSLILVAILWIYFGLGEWLGLTNNTVRFITNQIQTPADMALWSLLAFWITAACYRTFVVKSWESLVLLITGFAIILSNAPIGSLIFPPIDSIALWLNIVPAAGAGVGILMGTAIGVVTISLRQIVGVERSYLGVESEAGG